MICDPCRSAEHVECANVVDRYGEPRREEVRPNWCDCQHLPSVISTPDGPKAVVPNDPVQEQEIINIPG